MGILRFIRAWISGDENCALDPSITRSTSISGMVRVFSRTDVLVIGLITTRSELILAIVSREVIQSEGIMCVCWLYVDGSYII